MARLAFYEGFSPRVSTFEIALAEKLLRRQCQVKSSVASPSRLSAVVAQA